MNMEIIEFIIPFIKLLVALGVVLLQFAVFFVPLGAKNAKQHLIELNIGILLVYTIFFLIHFSTGGSLTSANAKEVLEKMFMYGFVFSDVCFIFSIVYWYCILENVGLCIGTLEGLLFFYSMFVSLFGETLIAKIVFLLICPLNILAVTIIYLYMEKTNYE